MKHLCDGVEMTGKIAVADFVCPTEAARRQFNADFVVWMDTIEAGRFDDTNKMFEKPEIVDYHVKGWFDDTSAQLLKVVKWWIAKKEGRPTERM